MATFHADTCRSSMVITYSLNSSPWSNECGRKGRTAQSAVITDIAVLYAGTCTMSKVTTYLLDLSSWIHGAIHVEERVEYHNGPRETATLYLHKE